MKTEKICIGKIKCYAKNIKKHSKEQIEKLKIAITKYGFVQPLVVDRNNIVVIGHGRLQALKELGYTDADVIVSQLSDKENDELRIADNKLTSLDYDDDLFRQFMLDADEDFKNLLDFEDSFISENAEIQEIENKKYDKKVYFVSFDTDVDTTEFELLIESKGGRQAFKYV